MLKNISLFLPELILIIGAVLMVVAALFVDSKDQKKERVLAIVISFMAVGGSLIALISQGGVTDKFFSNFLVIDPFALAFKVIFILVVLISMVFIFRSNETKDFGLDFYILMLTILVGMMLMASANNLLAIYLGLEMVSIPSYLMTAWKREGRGAEAAIKYTVYGGVASGIMVFGISLIYGLAGGLELSKLTSMTQIGKESQALWIVALLFIIVGFGYKIAAVPFHHWSPDVYEGAPTPITAFFSVGPKAAGFAVILRFFYHGTNSGAEHILTSIPWTTIIAIVAVITMFVGNLSALRQTSLKRMLAYSSIAHAGYMLMAVTASTKDSIVAIIFYLVIYLFMNIGAFAIISLVMDRNNGSDDIKHFNGLGSKNAGIAMLMAVFMFSLMGVPPFGGFIGKVYIFAALISVGSTLTYTVAIFGVINAALSVYYYMRVVKAMYLKDATDETKIDTCRGFKVALSIFSVIILITGIYWQPIYDFIASLTMMG